MSRPRTTLPAAPTMSEQPRECPHIKAWTIKWGIAGGQRWCDKCKKYIYPSIDWDGHP